MSKPISQPDLAELQALCARYQHLLGLDAWDIAVQECEPVTLGNDHRGAQVSYKSSTLKASISIPADSPNPDAAVVHELVELALCPLEEFYDSLAPTKEQTEQWGTLRHQAVVLLTDAILGRRTPRLP